MSFSEAVMEDDLFTGDRHPRLSGHTCIFICIKTLFLFLLLLILGQIECQIESL